MLLARLPVFVSDNDDCLAWRHAGAILAQDCPAKSQDVLDLLTSFRLRKSWIIAGGGGVGCLPLVFGIRKSLHPEDTP